MRQIADAAGIKAGSIYYHFGSKDEILGEVLDAGMAAVTNAVRERIDALPANASHRDRIAAAIDGHLYGLLHHGDFTSANIRIYGQIPPAAKARHRVVRRAYAQVWDDLLQAALDAGELRHDTNLAVIRLFLIGALELDGRVVQPEPRRVQLVLVADHRDRLRRHRGTAKGAPMTASRRAGRPR